MKLSTRLLAALLPTVAAVMLVYAAWAVAHRQQTLASQARSETRAYAAALGAALDYAFHAGQLENVQALIDGLSSEPTVYGVIVYDRVGRPLYLSRELRPGDAVAEERLAQLLASGADAGFEREIGEERVYSYLRPIRDSVGTVAGVLEVVQPFAFLEAEATHTGKRFLLNTLTLLLAVALLIAWLVRQSVTRPLDRLVGAIRALGQGDLSQRLEKDPGGTELAALAHEFNRMAAQLEAARAQLLQEAEERVTLERQVRETHKLAAVGNLAAGVAHEIAAPLNVIAGRTEMLLKSATGDELLKRNLTIIVDQIRRITTIVRNLLDFAKRRDAAVRAIDLTTVVKSVTEFLEGEFNRAGVELECETPEEVWVHGDPDLLRQVLVNLLINALQALEPIEGARRVRLSVAAGDEVVVKVEDNGPGIPDAAMPRIFDPFFTTKPAGTGLGLAVAKNIVEEMGGRMYARNGPEGERGRRTGEGAKSPAVGAVFEFTLHAAAVEHSRV